MQALSDPLKAQGGLLHPTEPALVIQLARLGDFLQTTPLLAALKKADPQRMVSVLVTPAQAPLARGCRWVDRVHVLDPNTINDAAEAEEAGSLRRARLGGLLGPIWESRAEEIYNLNLSRLCALIPLGWPGAGVKGWHLEGNRQGGASLVGEDWTPFMMHLVSDRRLTRLHLCDILASYAAPEGPAAKSLDFQVDEASARAASRLLPTGGPKVVLQLGANNDLRRWPLASFAGLARELMAQGARIVLAGSANERVLGRRLRRELGPAGGDVTDLMGRTTLPVLAGVLQAADLVVSADTGSLHLATAVGARVLALYMGPAQVHETGPYGIGHLVLQARDQCGPCQEHNPACGGAAPCRGLISAETVSRAAKNLLAGKPANEVGGALALPEGVDSLCGSMDKFGQRYQHLIPKPLDSLAGLALAMREAGRVLMRPGYQTDWQALENELNAEHLPAHPDDKGQMSGLARSATQLSGAAAAGDAQAARRILGQVPWLLPLSALIGGRAPASLEESCRTAAGTLEMVSEF